MQTIEYLNTMIKVPYSMFHEGASIVHVVGGEMNDDLKSNIDDIAEWFIQNDITLLWGDEWIEKFNENHPVANLANKIREKGGNTPIRILQTGDKYDRLIKDSGFSPDNQLAAIVNDEGEYMGVLDINSQNSSDEILIYSRQQQDRQKLYYNIADGLMVLNGGLGASYEIPNALVYGFTGDMGDATKIMIVDADLKFKNFVDAYLAVAGAKIKDFNRIEYYSSAKDFTEKNIEAGMLNLPKQSGEE